ncbi:MAG TPA: hypothetical protein VGG02_04290 [Chthoniobacterales bacterium]
MSFITTGLREMALKVRRQRTRMALRHEKRVLKKAEITLGREGTSEAARFPEVRAEIVALKKLEQEQKEFAVRIAQIEEALKQLDQQRQENSRTQSAVIAKLEEEKRPLVEARNEAKTAADNCGRELSAVDGRLTANEASDQALLKKISALQATTPPPDDLQAQLDQIAAERARLPNEKAQIAQARLGSAEACRAAKERLNAAEAAVAAADKNIAQVRSEFEARDRELNESSRAQQEEVRQARQQHQVVEEKKNPAYLNIGRHLATAGIAPPSAPHLLTDVQRHRSAVENHQSHWRELEELSSRIDKQELRKFYFAVVSVLVLLAIVLPLASQSPAKRDWLPQDTVAIFSLNPNAIANSAVAKSWQKEQPQMWQRIFQGLAGSAIQTPALNLARDSDRVTRAMTSDTDNRAQEYVLVETSGDIGPVLRAISKDQSFAQTTVSGLVVWQRGDVALARVGPKTLAVGSSAEVDQLVEVRLGMEPDLKVDSPLLKKFQTFDPDGGLRLIARTPNDLTRFFGRILPTELLNSSTLLGLSVTLGTPSKGHLFVRQNDSAAAKQLAASLAKEPARWLTLPNSDFVLSTATPKVEQSDAEVDVRFNIPESAARLLLQRLARVEPAP